MKQTKAAVTEVAVERWAVERLDRDADMARIEIVPMRPEKVSRTLLGALAKTGLLESMDDLSLWDGRKARIKGMKTSTLISKLGFRKEEKERLFENMVFWVIRSGEKGKADQVFHATAAARKTSKDLYHKVTRTEGDEK